MRKHNLTNFNGNDKVNNAENTKEKNILAYGICVLVLGIVCSLGAISYINHKQNLIVEDTSESIAGNTTNGISKVICKIEDMQRKKTTEIANITTGAKETIVNISDVKEEYTPEDLESVIATYYVICDVIEQNNGLITVAMQNGEFHKYYVEDAPMEIREICFRTHNLDNYEMYEVVALR